MLTLTSKIKKIFSSTYSENLYGWLYVLPENDPLAAQKIITQQLPKLLHENLLPDCNTLALVTEIDQRCRGVTEKLKGQYIRTAHLPEQLEAAMWDTSCYYHRHLAAHYQRLLDEYEALNATDLESGQVTQLIARTMASRISMIEWHLYRGRELPETSWRNLHALYTMAEKYQIENRPFFLFPGEPAVSTAEMYAQVLMLATLHSFNLGKHQISLVARCLKRWLKDIYLTNHYEPEQFVFYVDMGSDQAAKRIRKFKCRPDIRLFKTAQLTLIIKNDLRLLNHGIYPDYLAEHCQDFSLSQLKTLWEKLYSEWSVEAYVRQRRSEPRLTVTKTALMAYGLNKVIQQVKALTDAQRIGSPFNTDRRTLEERIADHAIRHETRHPLTIRIPGEKLLIVNQSASGVGILLSAEIAPDIKVGNLVLLIMEDTREALIGLVRSIKSRVNGERHVGIKLISFNPLIVELNPAAEQKPAFSQRHATVQPEADPTLFNWGFLGLLLNGDQSTDEPPSLILPRIEYNPHSIYNIICRKKRTAMQLGSPIESKTDWVRVACPSL